MEKNRGFTLIELMVVAAVIAILAIIAIPSYLSYIRQSRRSAAEAALQQVGLREERFRADCTNYCDGSTATSGCPTCNWATLGGDPSGTYYGYQVTVTAPVAATSIANAIPALYTATATAKGGQTKDTSQGTSCSSLTYGLAWNSTTSTLETSKTPAVCWSN